MKSCCFTPEGLHAIARTDPNSKRGKDVESASTMAVPCGGPLMLWGFITSPSSSAAKSQHAYKFDSTRISVVAGKLPLCSKGWKVLLKGRNFLVSKGIIGMCSVGESNEDGNGCSFHFAIFVFFLLRPLVNFRSCWAHNLPPEFHRFSVLATFVVLRMHPSNVRQKGCGEPIGGHFSGVLNWNMICSKDSDIPGFKHVRHAHTRIVMTCLHTMHNYSS